ncbi:MAG: adenylate/guanylate cyclase domain-containing protein [Saprospiraceae bacterium]
MKKRYYLSMLSMFPMVLLFDLIYLPAHKSVEMFLMLGAIHFILLAPLNFIGFYFIYKPIDTAFQNRQDEPKARNRIQQLTWHSTLWIFTLGVIYFGGMLLMIYSFPMDTGEITMEKMPAILWLTAIPSILFIYAILPAFITYFLINDFTLDLKLKAYAQFKVIYPVGKKRIGLTLLFTFIILGFLPSLLVTLELIASSAGDQYSQFSDMTPLEGILPDRLIVFIGMIYAVIFITRSFTKPIYSLLKEMNKVREGDFSTNAAIITEDEIGVLTNEFNEMVKGLKERELIRDTFGKYVTKDVANVILDQQINLQGEVRICTILVTDIANYTSISEGLSPEEIVQLLNEYFSVLVNIIQENNGVVNKFMGDSIFAIFNVPLDDPDHASHAINAALAIKEITATRKFGESHHLLTRIGINTGSVVAGNIGAADRMEYTVIGDDVNIAARLEQLNKQYNTQILVGENTCNLAKNQFKFKQIGDIQLKGKTQLIKVYEVEDKAL